MSYRKQVGAGELWCQFGKSKDQDADLPGYNAIQGFEFPEASRYDVPHMDQ